MGWKEDAKKKQKEYAKSFGKAPKYGKEKLGSEESDLVIDNNTSMSSLSGKAKKKKDEKKEETASKGISDMRKGKNPNAKKREKDRQKAEANQRKKKK